MKKRSFLAALLGLMMVLQCMATPALAKNNTVRSTPIPPDAYAFIESRLTDIYAITEFMLVDEGIKADLNQLAIGSPFTVSFDDSPDLIVFPILNNGEALLTIHLSQGDGYSLGMSGAYCHTLNTQTGSLFFFFSEGNEYYENNGTVEALVIYNIDIEEEELLALYEAGEEYVPPLPASPARTARSAYEEVDIQEPVFLFEDIELPVQTRELVDANLGLYQYKQDIPGTCWAATCASIINWYDPRAEYTASGICRQIHGFSHAAGCTGSRLPFDVQTALYEIGNARITAGPFQKITFELVQQEVDKNRPIFAHGEINSSQGHDLALTGWYIKGGNKYFRMMDSADTTNKGNVTEEYKEDNKGVFFKYKNYVFRDFMLTSK